VASFAYGPTWLADRGAFVLDRSHQLYEGEQYPSKGDIAGIFTDTAPDRWGRTLTWLRRWSSPWPVSMGS
jgi:serine/threonine-protein kinase HipA